MKRKTILCFLSRMIFVLVAGGLVFPGSAAARNDTPDIVGRIQADQLAIPEPALNNAALAGDCRWELYETTEAIANDDGVAVRSGGSIHTSFPHAGGEGCYQQTLNTTHIWTEPGAVLIPGSVVEFEVDFS
ncbi:MAG: hypothetical protein JXA42_25880 [Anaerolineales bacterium]|nr:hypothetical protein [Anaerolineales bacterium]